MEHSCTYHVLIKIGIPFCVQKNIIHPTKKHTHTHALLLLTSFPVDGEDKPVYLDVRRSDDGKVELKAKNAGGWIYEQDIYACKGYIQAIGNALVP